ncbi:hypothetical protein Droror1_Dr00004670 [Drosera rotundifolia]
MLHLLDPFNNRAQFMAHGPMKCDVGDGEYHGVLRLRVPPPIGSDRDDLFTADSHFVVGACLAVDATSVSDHVIRESCGHLAPCCGHGANVGKQCPKEDWDLLQLPIFKLSWAGHVHTVPNISQVMSTAHSCSSCLQQKRLMTGCSSPNQVTIKI